MKKDVTLSVDEDLLTIAKKHIPNLSKFFTECLESWLDYTDKNGEQRGAELLEQQKAMNMAKMKIYLLLEDTYYEENMEEKIRNKKNSDAWLRIWAPYRRGGKPDPKEMEEVMKILEIEDEEEMEDILFDAYQDFTHDLKDQQQLFDDWQYVKENYPTEWEVKK